MQSGKALSVLAEISVALLLALFLLAAGDTFRRKVAKIAGASLARRRVTVEVLDEIDGQIQVYMMTLADHQRADRARDVGARCTLSGSPTRECGAR